MTKKELATHKNLFNFLFAFCYVGREAMCHGEWYCVVCIENKPSSITTARHIPERSYDRFKYYRVSLRECGKAILKCDVRLTV